MGYGRNEKLLDGIVGRDFILSRQVKNLSYGLFTADVP